MARLRAAGRSSAPSGMHQLEVERHGRDDRRATTCSAGQVSGGRRGRAHPSRRPRHPPRRARAARALAGPAPSPRWPTPRRGRAHPAARDQIGLASRLAPARAMAVTVPTSDGTRRASGGRAGVDRAIDGSGHGGHDGLRPEAVGCWDRVVIGCAHSALRARAGRTRPADRRDREAPSWASTAIPSGTTTSAAAGNVMTTGRGTLSATAAQSSRPTATPSTTPTTAPPSARTAPAR